MSTAFAEWLATLRLDEPDEGGQVGTAPAGRTEFLRAVFDAHGGPVSREVLGAAWRVRERALVARGVALVEADIRHTTSLDPVIRVVEFDDGVVAATYNGSCQTPTVYSIREPESICEVADNLRDHIVDELWTVWPVCPSDGGGLDPRAIDGRAVWHCRVGSHVVADIGGLQPPTSARDRGGV